MKPVHQARLADISRASLQPLYGGPPAINQKKVDDLKLLEFIPPVYHSLYQNINQSGGDDSDEGEEEDEQEGESEEEVRSEKKGGRGRGR